MSEVTDNNNNARSDHGDEKFSHPQVFKAAKDATPPDKGKLDLDFRTEVIGTNKNARSNHGGGEAAHRPPLKEQTNKTISLNGISRK